MRKKSRGSRIPPGTSSYVPCSPCSVLPLVRLPETLASRFQFDCFDQVCAITWTPPLPSPPTETGLRTLTRLLAD